MYRKRLIDREIENALNEDIPSDNDSFAGGGDESETEVLPEMDEDEGAPPELLLGTSNSFELSDEEFDPEDEVPLASLRAGMRTFSPVPDLPSPAPLPSRPPKWKRSYTISAPEDYTPSNPLPTEILDLAARQHLTPLKIFIDFVLFIIQYFCK